MATQNPNVISLSAIVKAMYPDILTSTHTVPPMIFNQVAYRREMVPGTDNLPALVLQQPLAAGDAKPTHDLTPDSLQPVPSTPRGLWTPEPLSNRPSGPKPVLQTDVNDDIAQAQVLRNLQVLGENRKEAMFVVSQLNFTDYLQDPTQAVTVAHLPAVPADPNTGRAREGDFDILVVHRQFGILIGELKTVGKNPAFRTDAIVGKTVQKALKQLDKSKAVVGHLVSDVASPGLTVRTSIVLPFVNRKQLQEVFATNRQLAQHACNTLGAADAAHAAGLCLCSDQLSDPCEWWTVTPEVVNELDSWWQRRMEHTDPQLNDDKYIEVVARFVGPATTVTVNCATAPRVCVKTEGEAIAQLGRVLSTLILTPEQVDLMENFSRSLLPLVYLTGPPGTGKTVMLTLAGLCRLRSGKDVHVVSGHDDSMAASRLIKNQMESTLAAAGMSPAGCGKVFLHDYDLEQEAEKDRAVRDLTAVGPDVFLVFDELTGYGFGYPPRYFRGLPAELKARVPSLGLWAAGIAQGRAPPALREIPLSTPLRSAPSILREVQEQITGTGFWSGAVHPYNSTRFPVAGDGMRVERLEHDGGDRNGHTGVQPETCFLCGHNVAARLRRLGVGVPGSKISQRDVFILSRFITANCDLVRGVRDAGLAVRVMADPDEDRAGWEREVSEVAEAAWPSIVAADFEYVHGMERKVVVLLGGTSDLMLFAASRATTQLVVVSSHASPSSDSSLSDAGHSDSDASDADDRDADIQVMESWKSHGI